MLIVSCKDSALTVTDFQVHKNVSGFLKKMFIESCKNYPVTTRVSSVLGTFSWFLLNLLRFGVDFCAEFLMRIED